MEIDIPNPNHFLNLLQKINTGRIFEREQQEDKQLKHCWAQVRMVGKEVHLPGPHPLPYFMVRKGLLYCVEQRQGEEKLLLVVPKTKTEKIIELVYSHALAGYLGAAKTTQRICDDFHWPGMEAEVKSFFQECTTCKQTLPWKNLFPTHSYHSPLLRCPLCTLGGTWWAHCRSLSKAMNISWLWSTMPPGTLTRFPSDKPMPKPSPRSCSSPSTEWGSPLAGLVELDTETDVALSSHRGWA